MSWHQPLLDAYHDHLIRHHQHLNQFEIREEYAMMEEHLIYEKFRHAEFESIRCCMCDCDWKLNYTINFDLLTLTRREEE